MIIYKITNRQNGKMYIGATTMALSKRMLNHKYPGKSQTSLTTIQKAIQEHGKTAFDAEVIEECQSKEEMHERERHWIKELGTIIPDGYNVESGGRKSICHPSTIEKMKAIEKTPEWRSKISQGNKGRKMTEGQLAAFKEFRERKKTPEEVEKWYRGEANGRVVLTEDQVREIRRLYALNSSKDRWAHKEYTQDKLAAMFGVKQITISKIVTGANWKHLL